MQLEQLCKKLAAAKDRDDKLQMLAQLEDVRTQLSLSHYNNLYNALLSKEHKIAFLSMVALESAFLFFHTDKSMVPLPCAEAVLSELSQVDHFYDDIGGLIGYVAQVRRLLRSPRRDLSRVACYLPDSANVEEPGIFVKNAVTFGLAHLDQVAMVLTAGGLGERLGLVDEQKQPLPVAYLPFMGRSLLEGIIRDLEGLEQLYYVTYGRKIIIPLAIMSSKEQKNEENIRALFEKNHYFGRPSTSVRIFSQVSVPVLTVEGTFSVSAPAQFLFHPSGHGALWKTAEKAGVFSWLESQKISHLLLRQINNPIAALDYNFLAFLGLSIREKKGFGFFACERIEGAAEGALVDMHIGDQHCITNIEYSELQQSSVKEGLANTNILYANLSQIKGKLKNQSLFGPLLNMKSEVPCYLPSGEIRLVKGGRLESMMQNISEEFTGKIDETLPTIIVKNRRTKTIAAIKREYVADKNPLETAEAAYYTLLENNYELLAHCTSEPLPSFFSLKEFLEKGPSLIFCYHPMLGPLYEVIRKKLHLQNIAFGSFLELELADLESHNVRLRGSLSVQAIGGSCALRNVTVNNLGIDRVKTRSYCKGEIVHQECCRLIVGKGATLVIESVTLSGDQTIEVPANKHLTIHQERDGQPLFLWQKSDLLPQER